MAAANSTLQRLVSTTVTLVRNTAGVAQALYLTLRPGRKEGERARRNAEVLITACRAFAAKHGRLPESLEQLVPGFLPELPPAKFSGPTFGFTYDVSGAEDAPRHVLGWTDRVPFGRPFYVFEEDRWGYLD